MTPKEMVAANGETERKEEKMSLSEIECELKTNNNV